MDRLAVIFLHFDKHAGFIQIDSGYDSRTNPEAPRPLAFVFNGRLYTSERRDELINDRVSEPAILK